MKKIVITLLIAISIFSIFITSRVYATSSEGQQVLESNTAGK